MNESNPTLEKEIDEIIDRIGNLEVPKEKEDVFEVGLVMAGAVSAGAYTAGVVDFLLEALEEWEAGGDFAHKHKVKLKVMSGASAGGMQTAITAVMLHQKRSGTYKKSLGKEAWTEKVHIDALLTQKDLHQHFSVRSLLDSSIIEQIAKEYITDQIKESDKWTNELPYLDDAFKIYLTLTNLRGLPFEFELEGNSGFKFGMREHADYLYKKISKETNKYDWEEIKVSTVATGAFPIGLSARIVTRDFDYYKERTAKDNRNISPFLKRFDTEEDLFKFIAVDGGALNNEPLELARKALYRRADNPENVIEKLLEEGLILLERLKEVNPASYAEKRDSLLKIYGSKGVNKALILIDPFPNTITAKKNPKPSALSLLKLPAAIIGAIRGQASFKPEELIFTGHKDNFNRFAIAPVRHDNEGNKVTQNAIACGFFEGFGGFLEKDFREHDYQLGRRNCQNFLKKYFVLPKNYFEQNQAFSKNEASIKDEVKPKNTFYPIIPLYGRAEKEEKAPEWPSLTSNWVNTKKLIRNRIHTVLGSLIAIPMIKNWVFLLLVILLVGFLTGSYYLSCNDILESLCKDESPMACEIINGVNSFLGNSIIYLILFSLIALKVIPGLVFRWASSKSINVIEKEMEAYGIEKK